MNAHIKNIMALHLHNRYLRGHAAVLYVKFLQQRRNTESIITSDRKLIFDIIKQWRARARTSLSGFSKLRSQRLQMAGARLQIMPSEFAASVGEDPANANKSRNCQKVSGTRTGLRSRCVALKLLGHRWLKDAAKLFCAQRES